MRNFNHYSFIPNEKTGFIYLIFIVMFSQGCLNNNQGKKTDPTLVHLITLVPGHFHAALLQKSMYGQIDSTVYVFAPDGPEVKSYLALIDQYNTRADDPTGWKEKVYTGPDYLEKMLKEKPGNVVVIAGSNQGKTNYIKKAVDAGLNVLADKPMAITKAGFDKLQEAFADAKKNEVFLYDIMVYTLARITENGITRTDLISIPNPFKK